MNLVDRTPPEWDSDAAGPGKRLASAFGTDVVQGAIQSGGDFLHRHDPRHIRSGTGSFWHRAHHALLFTVLTFDEHGRTRFGVANVASIYASNAVSALWYAAAHRDLSENITAANIQMALGVAFDLFQELWPDIHGRQSNHASH